MFGRDPKIDRAAAVELIGYVAQHHGLYRGLTIGDHFTIASTARPGFDRARARLQLRRLGLDEEFRVGDLSGGEQAQVALALALGTAAPLLLLDEPLASLDPLARRDFLRLLVSEVRARGVTTLLSSHIVSDVETTCDRLVVLSHGLLVLDADVAAARSQFVTVPAAEQPGPAIGRFSLASGEEVALVAGGRAGRPASLEEIVLGHLAAGRPQTEIPE